MTSRSCWLLLSIYLGLILPAHSQAGGQRYKDAIFQQVKVDSVEYRVVDGQHLFMDIYQPVGDTAISRPLVILAHGGSFMHGDRRCDRQQPMCKYLVQRGYVAVSIDYRLTSLLHMAAKRSAFNAIMKSVDDGRASVTWFLNDIAKSNSYHIDKNKIFFGGSSAGAILAEQLGFIDSCNECKSTLRKSAFCYFPDSSALPAHTIRGVISLAGAVLDTSIIGPNQPALLHIHGDGDRIVPYGYKRAVKGLAPFRMAGLEGCRPRYTSQHLDFTEYVFKNAGHTPWDEDDGALAIVLQQMVEFLYKETR